MKALFGIRAIEVLLFRQANTERTASVAAKDKGDVFWLFAGVTVHATIVAISLYLGWWWATLAWVLGMAMVFPFFLDRCASCSSIAMMRRRQRPIFKRETTAPSRASLATMSSPRHLAAPASIGISCIIGSRRSHIPGCPSWKRICKAPK
jgi:hypothetical protein